MKPGGMRIEEKEVTVSREVFQRLLRKALMAYQLGKKVEDLEQQLDEEREIAWRRYEGEIPDKVYQSWFILRSIQSDGMEQDEIEEAKDSLRAAMEEYWIQPSDIPALERVFQE
jgi:hypothetical protein